MRLGTKVLGIGLMVALMSASPSFGLAGVGVHYGVSDLTLNMNDTPLPGEMLFFEQLQFNATVQNAGQISVDSLPISVLRSGFEPTWLNLGGKAYIDVIPFLDAVEVSANFGVWQYEGTVRYPTTLNETYVQANATEISSGNYEKDSLFLYEETALTLKEFGVDYLGFNKTPYAKLHFDLSFRKNIVKLPMKVLRIYAGGGLSAHFATPVLSSGMVEQVVQSSIENIDENADLLQELNQGVFDNPEVMEQVVYKIIEGLSEPTMGMHVLFGTMVKPPIIPVGVYVDGKLMIPFGAMDPNVDLGGYGLLLNAGLTFGL